MMNQFYFIVESDTYDSISESQMVPDLKFEITYEKK